MSDRSDPAGEDRVQPPAPDPPAKDAATTGPASHPDITLMVSVIGVVMLMVAAGALGFARGAARANDVAAPVRAAGTADASVNSRSALVVEPLTPKVVVRHDLQPRRRNTPPPFANSFNAALKPYLAGDYTAALERFRELMVRYPAAPEPLVYAGVCELILGRPREAADHLKQAEPLTREVFLEDIAWYLALAHHAMGERSVEMELRTLCAVGGDHGARACAAVREIESRSAPQ